MTHLGLPPWLSLVCCLKNCLCEPFFVSKAAKQLRWLCTCLMGQHCYRMGFGSQTYQEQERHKLFIIIIIFNLHLFRTRWFELTRKPFFPLLHNPKSLSSVVLPYLALPRGCSIMNSGTGCKVNNARQAKSPAEGYFILPDLIVSEQLSLVNPTKKSCYLLYKNPPELLFAPPSAFHPTQQ